MLFLNVYCLGVGTKDELQTPKEIAVSVFIFSFIIKVPVGQRTFLNKKVKKYLCVLLSVVQCISVYLA